ncbi:TonB-dependent receptor [Novosphingobium sp. FSY-8]|uniref:TonB-dependent receptor n=1 Tax=Novosphingobium ovatum TaxID=1908523 RepID=A0ABW9XB28_9SPHN|nr:TonB-dependent receptor [Novosphingobium ovatum]NBC35738.1 TonB-dependent receptor [Novosphingobium ovatum]
MRHFITAALAGALIAPSLASAQDLGSMEVIVTARRRSSDDYSPQMPAIGLRRQADFAVQGVVVRGDTRDSAQREQEIYAMVRGAVALAGKQGLQLAFGEEVLQPLTAANVSALGIQRDSRPDSAKITFLVKAPLSAGMTAQQAQARITAFLKAVTPVGRAQIEAVDDLTFSVVGPDQYRPAISEAIAADARAMAARVGPDYAVQIENLQAPVEWARSGPSEVFLYLPYRLSVLPRRP